MKKFFGATIAAFLISSTSFAMTFSPPAEIGKVGFPVQAPYNGFIIDGATENTGAPYLEENQTYKGAQLYTYKKGVATFGSGKDALFCDYDFETDDYLHSLKFGGRGDYVLLSDMSFKDILKINSDENLTLYIFYHNYCTSHLNIIGVNNGVWQNYVDSKKVSEMYFGGNDGYKLDGSIIYEKPRCSGDTLIIPYHRWHWEGETPAEGEIRLKWDAFLEWFSIEQITY